MQTQTIMQNLLGNSNEFSELEDLREENESLQKKVEELEEEINDQDSYIDVNDCEEYTTALGTIHIHNQTGNLKLQEEMDDFFEKLIRKYN